MSARPGIRKYWLSPWIRRAPSGTLVLPLGPIEAILSPETTTVWPVRRRSRSMGTTATLINAVVSGVPAVAAVAETLNALLRISPEARIMARRRRVFRRQSLLLLDPMVRIWRRLGCNAGAR